MAKVITLPELCGHYSFERLLLKFPPSSTRGQTTVEFDLGRLKWIGLLPLSLLYGWIRRLRDDGAHVTLRIPEVASSRAVLGTLLRMGFFRALEALGVEVSGSLPSTAPVGLAVFQPFETQNELATYERTLSTAGRLDDLLGGGNDMEIVSSGDFRDILLHELGENAFLHGRGKAVRFLIAELPRRENPDRGGFEVFFDGRETVEIVVSDGGPGLVSTLNRQRPKAWSPSFGHDSSLSVGALTCAYALEFSSTSDPAGRRERLRHILESGGEFVDAIPTGLFYVASLVRHYGGQLIIRTGRFSVSVDYSRPGGPILKEDPLDKQGLDVSGTHILIRLPSNARGFVHSVTQKPRRLAAAKLDEGVEPVVLEEKWAATNGQPHTFIMEVEKAVEQVLSTRPESQGSMLVLLANGLSADPKTLSLLLTWLGTVPHRNWTIAVLGIGGELLAPVAAQSAQVAALARSPKQRLLAWQPFLIAGDKPGPTIQFGAPSQEPVELTNFAECYSLALERAVGRLLQHEPVHHVEKSNRYYLIEGKYYTQIFYEIRQLTSKDPKHLGTALAAALVGQWVQQHEIESIFTLAEPLVDFTELLSQLLPAVRCVARHSPTGNGQFAHEFLMHDRARKYLLLTDVVCTGRQFEKYFAMAPSIENCRIATFVDGRDSQLPYITATKSDAAYSVKIMAALHRKIPEIRDLPHEEDTEILLIDRRTHAPTPKDVVSEVQIGPVELMEAARDANALYHGHIQLGKKHYVDLVLLPALFEYIHSKLELFWNKMLQTLAELKVQPEHISVFYLQESKGWEHAVPRFMATKRVAECRPIRREDLFAPPVEGETLVKGRCVWFILPVIASGATTRRCLEYASRLKPVLPAEDAKDAVARVVISAVIGRMSPTELSFYQGVSGYKRSKTKIEVLSFLPLPAYSSEHDCPVCIALRTLEVNGQRIESSPEMYKLFGRARGELHVRDAQDEMDSITQGHPAEAAVLAQMSALFEHGVRDVLMRKKLAEMLDAEQGRLRFLEMVGAHCDHVRFGALQVQPVLYSRYEPLRQDTHALLQMDDVSQLTLHRLLGAHVLFPDLVALELKWLLQRAVQQEADDVVSRLILLALLEPKRYGPILAAAAHVVPNPPQRVADMLREIGNCTLWFGTARGSALTAFEYLFWLLRRSTDWGSEIEELRGVFKTSGDLEALRAAFYRFEFTALNLLLGKMANIRASDENCGLWSAIRVEGGDPDAPVARILTLAQEIRATLGRGSENLREDLLRQLSELDQHGHALANALEKLYTNVRDAVTEVSSVSFGRWPELNEKNIKIEFHIADNQPGVLFGLRHLTGLLKAILENVVNFLRERVTSPDSATEPLWLRFSFIGFTQDHNAAVLEVHDNIPFDKPLVPSGGLKQVEDRCGTYGAIFSRGADLPAGSSLRMSFRFRIDRFGRSHGHGQS